jgi:hypothetical protein
MDGKSPQPKYTSQYRGHAERPRKPLPCTLKSCGECRQKVNPFCPTVETPQSHECATMDEVNDGGDENSAQFAS